MFMNHHLATSTDFHGGQGGHKESGRAPNLNEENQAVARRSTFHVADKTSSRTRIRVYSIQFYIVVTRGEGGDGYTHDVPRPRDARAQSCRPTDDCRISTEGSRLCTRGKWRVSFSELTS